MKWIKKPITPDNDDFDKNKKLLDNVIGYALIAYNRLHIQLKQHEDLDNSRFIAKTTREIHDACFDFLTAFNVSLDDLIECKKRKDALSIPEISEERLKKLAHIYPVMNEGNYYVAFEKIGIERFHNTAFTWLNKKEKIDGLKEKCRKRTLHIMDFSNQALLKYLHNLVIKN